MIKVETAKGLIDRDLLNVRDEVHETADARVIQTIWSIKETGEDVRVDATVSILRGLTTNNLQGM